MKPNRYAAKAEQYLRQENPARYQQLTDPTSYFQALGVRIEQRIKAEERRLADNQTAGDRSPIQERAERAVCSDLSWLLRSADPTDPDGRTDETGTYLGWTDPTLRSIRAHEEGLEDWERSELDAGRDPTSGQPLLADPEITRRARENLAG